MASAIGSLIRNASREKGDRLNVISFPTHESYQTGLSNTNADFYLWRGPGIKDWSFQYRQLPRNHHLLDPNKGDNQLPIDVNFDVVLSQNAAGQYPVAIKLAKFLHLPLICLTHVLPPPNVPKDYLQQMKTLRGDVNLFISEYSRQAWGWAKDEADVIHHAIDSNIFAPNPRKQREKVILSVVNDWKNRDWCCGYNIWERVTQGLPVRVLGDNPGLSEPAKSLTDLAQNYQSAQVFLNTSLISPIPTSLLEAASSACAIVSTSNCMIPEIFTHGKDAFLTNDERAVRLYLQKLLDDPKLAEKMGAEARKTVMEKFSLEKFTDNWNKILYNAANRPFRG